MKPVNPRILTMNGGSSSTKFVLFEVGGSLRPIVEGGIARIGLPEALFRVKGLNPERMLANTVCSVLGLTIE
jgi:acetate kinase